LSSALAPSFVPRFEYPRNLAPDVGGQGTVQATPGAAQLALASRRGPRRSVSVRYDIAWATPLKRGSVKATKMQKLSIGFLAFVAFASATFGSEPTFSEFRVPVETITKPKINLRSHPIGRRYRTQIRWTVHEKGVNFAGHFTVVTWGCGTECSLFAIVDLRTGRIWHDPELIATRSLEFRADSRLMVFNPWNGPDDFAPQVATVFYVWSGSQLRKMRVIKHAA